LSGADQQGHIISFALRGEIAYMERGLEKEGLVYPPKLKTLSCPSGEGSTSDVGGEIIPEGGTK